MTMMRKASDRVVLGLALAAACALAVTPARAQGEKENATSLVVLSKTECVDLAPIQEFSTDNRIISCVRNASEMCCEAMDELLGQDSAVHFCTCSSGVLEDVLDEAVPLFAKDIIRTRIEECGLPIAGEERCAGLYDDSGAAYAAASGDCADEYPPNVDTKYNCKQQADYGKCGEGWMQGYCLASCGKCELAKEEEKEASATAASGKCEDEYPPDVDTSYTCQEQADYGKCDEGWMKGYCRLSCGECTAEVEEDSSPEAEEEVVEAEDGEVLSNGTIVAANCTDEKSPSDDSRHDCAKQASFGKCSEGWMDGYCLLSCGKCIKPEVRTIMASAAGVAQSVAPNTTTDEIEQGNSTGPACADDNCEDTTLLPDSPSE